MEYKKYTKKEIDTFCEDNFIEETDWLWRFIKVANKAKVSMDGDGVLTVKIAEDEVIGNSSQS